MKTTELRIGNRVLSDDMPDAEFSEMYELTILEVGETCKVDWEGESMFRHIEDIHPMPLTEKILLKLGFQKEIVKGILFDTTEYEIVRNGYSLIQLEKDNNEDKEIFEITSPQTLFNTIKYVHQLQNWYWINNKCKKELTFKSE